MTSSRIFSQNPHAELKIERLEERHVAGVRALNARIAKKGGRWRFYDTVIPRWLAPVPGASTWREIYVLVDQENNLVRGGCVLKPEQFYLNGSMIELGWLQGPVAESAVDKSLKGLGGILVRFSLERFPLQISWGANSIAAPSAGNAPMLLRVVNAKHFVRALPTLKSRTRIARSLGTSPIASVAAFAIKSLQLALELMGRGPALYTSEETSGFGTWADDIWVAARSKYRLIALRDQATLNRIMPRSGYPEAIPLKVIVDGQVVGWAALRDRQLTDDPLFGSVRAGSIIDALALPGHEATVAHAAVNRLIQRGVDMVGACFLHPDWIRAFRDAGCIVVPDRRNIGFTAALTEQGGGVSALLRGTHLALIDSDGPRLF